MKECPTPWGVPIAIAECPHCGGAIGVTLRARAQLALPAGPGQLPPPPSPCCACPHCGVLVYPALRATGPIAITTKSDATALMPKTADERATALNDRRIAITEKMPKPPL